MPHLYVKFTGPCVFIACEPEGSLALLIDTGATNHVAGALWRIRLKIPPPEWAFPPAP